MIAHTGLILFTDVLVEASRWNLTSASTDDEDAVLRRFANVRRSGIDLHSCDADRAEDKCSSFVVVLTCGYVDIVDDPALGFRNLFRVVAEQVEQ